MCLTGGLLEEGTCLLDRLRSLALVWQVNVKDLTTHTHTHIYIPKSNNNNNKKKKKNRWGVGKCADEQPSNKLNS